MQQCLNKHHSKPTLENAFKHRNDRNLRINVLFYVHLRPCAPKVLKSSSQISQNVRKQLGIKLLTLQKYFKAFNLEKYAARQRTPHGPALGRGPVVADHWCIIGL